MTQAAARPPLGLGPDDEIDLVRAAANAHRMAAMLRAVRLAAKCFDIARTSQFAGERDAAFSRGIAIAEKAGLVLELFDIPRREEQRLRYALRDVDETLQRWASQLRAEAGETIYDAKRRAFHAEASAAAERDRAAGRRATPAPDLQTIRRAELLDRWPSTGAALNALRARRVEVFPIDLPPTATWSVPSRALDVIDEWQLRELADEVCA